jgi:hypothetical protein
MCRYRRQEVEEVEYNLLASVRGDAYGDEGGKSISSELRVWGVSSAGPRVEGEKWKGVPPVPCSPILNSS